MPPNPWQVAVFEGACYTTPLLGAVFADSLWGRYKTILVFSMIYLLVRPHEGVVRGLPCSPAAWLSLVTVFVSLFQGIGLLTLSSWPPMGAMPGPDEDPGWWAYATLCGSLGVIALGTGEAGQDRARIPLNNSVLNI